MFNKDQIATVKGMLARGDKQHAIAAFFAVNGGRVAEIATGKVGANVSPAPAANLPPADFAFPARPRYFKPDMPLDEQIEIFDSLSKKGPFDSARAHYISPELAEHMLKLNPPGNNRPKRVNNIALWADDMREESWGLTGEPLIFSKPPVRLLDGQHRLAACVQAGVGFKTFVVFGIDRGEFTKINTGAKKTNADALAILGVRDPNVVAAAVRWIHLLSTNPLNRSALSNDFVVDFYNDLKKQGDDVALYAYCDAAREIVKLTKKQHKVPYAPGQLAGLLYFLNSVAPKATERFLESLLHNKGSAKVLTTKLLKILDHGRIHDVGRAAMIIKAWQMTRDGVTATASSVSWDADKEAFPTV